MKPPSAPPQPSLVQLWSLREDSGFLPDPDGPGTGLVSTPWGDVRLPAAAPVVARALERMTYGPVSLDNVLPGFADGIGPEDGDRPQHAALRDALTALQHVVVRTLAMTDGTHQMTVVPTARRSRFAPGRPEADTVYRLSRFAVLRTGPEGGVVESLLSVHRVLLHTPQAGWLVGCHMRPTAVREAARLLGRPVEETRLAVGYLAAAGILVPGIPRPGGTAPVFAEDREAPLAPWPPHELMLHQRSRPGAHREPVGRTAVRVTDRGARAVRDVRGDVIALPVPGPAREGEPGLSEVLATRRSPRVDGGRPLSLEELGELLHRSAGVHTSGRRPYPSAGSRYPLELYLTIAGGGDLKRGVYHHAPHEHLLTPLDTAPDLVDDLLGEAGTNAGLSHEPPVLISMTAHFPRMAAFHRGTAYTALLKEIGALRQTLYLVATSMGLGACALAFGDNEAAARAFGLDWQAEPGVGELVLSALPEPAAGGAGRRSEPARVPGDPYGVHPVPGAELGYRGGQVIAHGTRGQEQSAGDLRNILALRGQPQDLGLPVAERTVADLQGGECQLRVHHPASGSHLADRSGEPGGVGVLEQEPRDLRLHRAAQVPGPSECGQDDRAAPGQFPVEPRRGPDAVDPRHVDVEDRDVRAVLARQGEHSVAVVGLGHHFDVRFEFEQRDQGAAEYQHVLGEQNPDHCFPRRFHGDRITPL
ncbi:hypothetical protein GCM10023079_55220 [Streptomyces chitinivorans]